MEVVVTQLRVFCSGGLPRANHCHSQLALASLWGNLGKYERFHGRFLPCEEAYRRRLPLLEELLELSPQDPNLQARLARAHDDLAWVLATRPDWNLQSAAESLQHAQRAVTLQPEYHDWWHTLGVAHCRLGHWKDALEFIEKSRHLQKSSEPPDSFDRFFEAMAYWGLGKKEDARRCYEEGAQWMDEHLRDHADLRRFRVEAALMLGIAGKP